MFLYMKNMFKTLKQKHKKKNSEAWRFFFNKCINDVTFFIYVSEFQWSWKTNDSTNTMFQTLVLLTIPLSTFAYGKLSFVLGLNVKWR